MRAFFHLCLGVGLSTAAVAAKDIESDYLCGTDRIGTTLNMKWKMC